MTRFIRGEHPERGSMWAAIDATVRFTTPEVRTSRLGASLAPYADEDAALAALKAAGASVLYG